MVVERESVRNCLFGYFQSCSNDSLNLTFSHRTNSREQLKSAFDNDNISIIEADVYKFDDNNEV